MKKYLVANWKANKNFLEVKDWVSKIKKSKIFEKINPSKVEIIICPPFPFIWFLKENFTDYSFVKIGAQDISFFDEGPYTGEVCGKNLLGLVDYVIIGHSERREYFKEEKEILFKKFSLAKKYQIEPLFCVRDENDSFPSLVKFVVWEPKESISKGSGFGKSKSVEEIIKMKNKLKLSSLAKFFYGGSVNETNIKSYLQSFEIDGVLIGGASLLPERFIFLLSVF